MRHSPIQNDLLVLALAAVVAGTTDQTTDWIDTQGFHHIEFTALFGTLTAGQATTTKLQYSDDNSTSAGDVAGSATAALADGDSDTIVRSGIYRPTHRYVRMLIDRGTANAVISGVLARLSNTEEQPVTQDATVAVAIKELNAPAIGTA